MATYRPTDWQTDRQRTRLLELLRKVIENTWKHRKKHDSTRELIRIQVNIIQCRRIYKYTWVHKELRVIQESTREHRRIKGNTREHMRVQMNTWVHMRGQTIRREQRRVQNNIRVHMRVQEVTREQRRVRDFRQPSSINQLWQQAARPKLFLQLSRSFV